MNGKTCLLLILALLLFLSGCVSDTGRESSTLIKDVGSNSTNTSDNQTETEIIERPDNSIFLQSGFCACKAGKPAILGQCGTFCAGKDESDQNTTLYLEAKLGEEILLNSEFGNLYNWCNKAVTNSNSDSQTSCANPQCVFRLTDSDGDSVDLDLSNLKSTSNKFEVILNSDVEFDKTYIGKIVENQCSQSKSDSIQLRRISSFDDPGTLSPLKVDPVSGYSCLTRDARVDGASNTIFYDTGFKLHFYYIDFNQPPVIPANIKNVFCHDIARYGSIDNISYPRLELNPGAFNVWSVTDSRFYDIKIDPELGDVNGKIDIHDTIDTIIKQNGYSSGLTFNLFYELKWSNFPSEASGDSNSANSGQAPLGYIMAPFIDPSTNRSFCPKFADYTDPERSPAIQAMKDVVGVDTEGLYLGVKEPEAAVIEGELLIAPDDYIIVNETLLKQIWFYFQNEQAIAPTSLTEGTKTLHFYWPPNTASPYIRNSDQKLYTVRHPSQISNNNGSSGTFSTIQVPHDKKFACAPAGE